MALASADRRLLLQQWLSRLSHTHLECSTQHSSTSPPKGDHDVVAPRGDHDVAAPRGDDYGSALRSEFEDASEQSDVVTVAAIGWSECLYPGVDGSTFIQHAGVFLRQNWNDLCPV